MSRKTPTIKIQPPPAVKALNLPHPPEPIDEVVATRFVVGDEMSQTSSGFANLAHSIAAQASDSPTVSLPRQLDTQAASVSDTSLLKQLVPPIVPKPPLHAQRGIISRKTKGDQRRMMVYLDPTVARGLAHYVVDHGRTASDVVNEAVRRLLAGE